MDGGKPWDLEAGPPGLESQLNHLLIGYVWMSQISACPVTKIKKEWNLVGWSEHKLKQCVFRAYLSAGHITVLCPFDLNYLRKHEQMSTPCNPLTNLYPFSVLWEKNAEKVSCPKTVTGHYVLRSIPSTRGAWPLNPCTHAPPSFSTSLSPLPALPMCSESSHL